MNRFHCTILATSLLISMAASAAEGPPAPAAFPDKVYTLDVVVTEKGILGDFAGAAEVFREAADKPFRIKYVSTTLHPVTLKGGMRIIPDYSFENAPRPDYVLMGSQGTKQAPAEALEWLKGAYKDGATIVSVCTGLDWLAQTGLIDNKSSAVPHLAVARASKDYPEVQFVNGKRYVQSDPQIFTGAAFFSGTDLALHILDVRYGRSIAQRTADRLEYRGDAWITNENEYSQDAGR